ncbi:MAG: hypothetical protein OXG95_04445 [Chloroflexi bacterium]|nr:hypothetical protein [Chloroflexota bacterium]
MTQAELRYQLRRFRIQMAGLVVATNFVSGAIMLTAMYLLA